MLMTMADHQAKTALADKNITLVGIANLIDQYG